jgi:hypothetical protein
MFSDKDLEDMGIGKGYTFLTYVIFFLIGALILVFVVAFIHDLFTGQLPGSSDPCSQYTTYEAQEFCAENLP